VRPGGSCEKALASPPSWSTKTSVLGGRGRLLLQPCTNTPATPSGAGSPETTTSAAFSRAVRRATSGRGAGTAGGATNAATAWKSAAKPKLRTLAPVDFDLTPEQREVQATVRQFVEERVLPNAIENDINHHLDMSVIEGMGELGLLGVVIPEENGGAGMDFVSEALACEEIERGEAAFRTLISVHVGLNSLSLLRYASEQQKERYLAPQARGEKIACFGLTEPAAGSDVAAMRTNARREGETYVLNGQ
jgi:hypothetical protein